MRLVSILLLKITDAEIHENTGKLKCTKLLIGIIIVTYCINWIKSVRGWERGARSVLELIASYILAVSLSTETWSLQLDLIASCCKDHKTPPVVA